MRPPIDLTTLRVTNPCAEAWECMPGTDRVRHCFRCQLNVYNLSALTRPEAEALVRENEGQLCVRYFERPDGTLLTADCSQHLGTAARGLEWLAVRLCALAILLLGFVFVLAPTPETRTSDVPLRDIEPFKTFHDRIFPQKRATPPTPPTTPTMGKMCMPSRLPTR